MSKREVVKLLKPMLLGQPKNYNWTQQNYNAGYDQALHAVARVLLGIPKSGKSPLA